MTGLIVFFFFHLNLDAEENNTSHKIDAEFSHTLSFGQITDFKNSYTFDKQ